MMDYKEFRETVIKTLVKERWSNAEDVRQYVSENEDWVQRDYAAAVKKYKNGEDKAIHYALNSLISCMQLDF